MNCQRCGKNEVSFHYSSNVNGKVTEAHLCSQCAAESGYDVDKLLAQGRLFDQSGSFNLNQLVDIMFPVHGASGFIPLAIPMVRTNPMLPYTARARTGRIEQDTPHVCGCGKSIARDPEEKVDEEMNMRRELNAQMRAAVEKEEFEKAAELRDRIKELELNGTHGVINTPRTERMNKCDSETTIQDSPTDR